MPEFNAVNLKQLLKQQRFAYSKQGTLLAEVPALTKYFDSENEEESSLQKNLSYIHEFYAAEQNLLVSIRQLRSATTDIAALLSHASQASPEENLSGEDSDFANAIQNGSDIEQLILEQINMLYKILTQQEEICLPCIEGMPASQFSENEAKEAILKLNELYEQAMYHHRKIRMFMLRNRPHMETILRNSHDAGENANVPETEPLSMSLPNADPLREEMLQDEKETQNAFSFSQNRLLRIKDFLVQHKYLALLLSPALLAFLYFLLFASPMYISHASFAIRNADSSSSAGKEFASLLLPGGASSASNDSFIINDYIQSLDIAKDIARELNLIDHFSNRSHDIISRLWSSPTDDDWLKYWRRVVITEHNVDTGIISLEVRAYSPEVAQKMTQAILKRGENLVNAMNERAQRDAVELARQEVTRAEERIRNVQNAMRNFRNTHNLLDPKTTAAGVQTLVSRLETEAATLRTQIMEARAYMRKDAPLLKSLHQRLDAVEKQLETEIQRVAGQTAQQSNLNALVADYEDLTIEADFAQKQLISAMNSMEQARIQQTMQSRYVVAYQTPTLPDESLYPRPFLFTVYIFLGTLILAGIVSLITVSIREHMGF
ncbi:MAG: hypothetical protein PUB69_02245 [Desulfovibrionaceae bacterium]|nr:hypothetical protein [Desulfovibrionaceae bacterium]